MGWLGGTRATQGARGYVGMSIGPKGKGASSGGLWRTQMGLELSPREEGVLAGASSSFGHRPGSHQPHLSRTCYACEDLSDVFLKSKINWERQSN